MSSNKQSSIVSDMARAKGLGSAHEGAHHWMMQRITAVAALPLCLWLVYSAVALKGASHEQFTAWLALPWNAVLMILFVLAVFYHAVLGAQVVVEDYIHTKWFKMMKLIGMKLFFTALAVVCIFSVLKIAL
jgi:succinate dehydrogenase / fumarate reductase membrane anchor subunit